MTKKQLAAVAVTGLLIAITYLFGRFTPKLDDLDNQTVVIDEEEKDASATALEASEFLQSIKERLSSAISDSLDELTAAIPKDPDNYRATINFLIDHDELLAASIYAEEYAKTTTSVDTLWEKAGDMYLRTLRFANLDNDAFAFTSEKAPEMYQKAINLNPDNMDATIKMAEAFMEDQSTIMNGVTLLLEVVKQDSMQPEANLILGKFGVISGQYDKAIKRLEKVVSLQAQNTEAYFLLADAYMGKGDKTSAIATFERCKVHSTDERLIPELDRIINNLKSSQ